MKTRVLHNFGNTYILSEEEIERFETLNALFDEEEQYILSLRNIYGLEVREDLLILFVQMYLLRFSIPSFQLTREIFPCQADILALKKVLYSCLVGRFIDDLVDADSQLFKTYESLLLYRHYSDRLKTVLSEPEQKKFDQYLFESTKYQSPVYESTLTFGQIRNDVYQRIRYFFCETETWLSTNLLPLQTYAGILLGGLDVNDLIADGYEQKSSTVISNYAYRKFYNDEGKLLLDRTLLGLYADLQDILKHETEDLLLYCNEKKLHYTASILKSIER